MAFLIGFGLVALLGVAHHCRIAMVHHITPDPRVRPNLAITSAFAGFLTLHSAENLAFAVIYQTLLSWDWMGTLAGDFDGSWAGLIYFSGINFATLGYTQIETVGPIRLVSMMQSLGGFMMLTWSATVIYSICGSAWED